MSDDHTLWVGGLTDQVTEDLLFELFLQAGPLAKVSRPKDKNGAPRNFAFVEFVHSESVPYAIQIMEGIQLFGRELRLKARTGSQHDTSGQQQYPGQDMNQYTSSPHSQGYPGSRNGQELQRSRSYQELMKGGPLLSPTPLAMVGNGHHKPLPQRSFSGGEGGQPFNGPVNMLAQPFSNMGSFQGPHMQPQNISSRRQQVLQQQALSLQAHAQRAAMNAQNPYGSPNYAQSFAGYGQQHMQPHSRNPWNPSQPQRQQFF